MKCPKCSYLGFDTGNRCRNCGYGFSLSAADLELKRPGSASETARTEPDLPLFSPAGAADDQPLVRLPAAPRAPLAVRRTPDLPRARTVARPAPRPDEPVLEFPDTRTPAGETPDDLLPQAGLHGTADRERRRGEARQGTARTAPVAGESVPLPSGRWARTAAAAIDLALLIAIDAAVVYFTLRIVALTMSDWQMLPPLPMLAFLALLKIAYFSAFTALGGQTIGKMAARIRVVTDDHRPIDPVRALRRTLAGGISLVTCGAGFLPALIGPDSRALHDRLAHTRVVTLAR